MNGQRYYTVLKRRHMCEYVGEARRNRAVVFKKDARDPIWHIQNMSQMKRSFAERIQIESF